MRPGADLAWGLRDPLTMFADFLRYRGEARLVCCAARSECHFSERKYSCVFVKSRLDRVPEIFSFRQRTPQSTVSDCRAESGTRSALFALDQ
jgi:hypothetical protein